MFRSLYSYVGPYRLHNRRLTAFSGSGSSHVPFAGLLGSTRQLPVLQALRHAPHSSFFTPYYQQPSSAPRPSPEFLLPLQDGEPLTSPFDIASCSPDQTQTNNTKKDVLEEYVSRGLPDWVKLPGVATEGKVDLSYVNVRKYEAREVFKPTLHDIERGRALRKRSLPMVTVDYLQHIHPFLYSTDKELEVFLLDRLDEIFSKDRLSLLNHKGYRPEDVVCWGWVLSSSTADEAIARMYGLMSLTSKGDRFSSSRVDVPFFLYLLILRSSHLSAISITLLIRLLRLRLSAESDASPERLKESWPDHTTAIILSVRLVRHARRVASYLMDPIAALTIVLLRHPALVDGSPRFQLLTHAYNRMLSLFAIPTSQHPFLSIPDQQRAQFRLIRAMTQFKSPLPVTREGYRALSQVQVAHKKTDNERDWARTKGLGWPPWKEDKLGISEDVEYPGSRSRASEILLRQVEAGYSHLDWEKRAQILSGWDMDGSPTIQTRQLLRKAPIVWIKSFIEYSGKTGQKEEKDDRNIWAARIRATRTVKEAWACFCAYDVSDSSSQRHQEPYHAIFEKLASHMHQTDLDSSIMPGDGREVYADSGSPRDFLYVPVDVPSMQTLYEKMRQDKVQPAGGLLTLLLDQAKTLEQGIRYIEESRLTEVRKDVLLNSHKYEPEFIEKMLNLTRDYHLASFLAFLQRVPKQSSTKVWYRPSSQSETNRNHWHIRRTAVESTFYGLKLMEASKSRSLQVYNAILRAIVQSVGPTKDKKSMENARSSIRRVLFVMRTSKLESVDFATFASVRAFVEMQLQIGTHSLRRSLLHVVSDDYEDVIRDDLRLVKSLFARAAVGMNEAEVDIVHSTSRRSNKLESNNWLQCGPESMILSTPSPSDLHLLMRLLSRCGDHAGILSLLRWMDRFAINLASSRIELANGNRQMRLALTAVRVGLEFEWNNEVVEVNIGREAQIREARELVERHEDWGNWPSNTDVKQYVAGREGTSKHQLFSGLLLLSEKGTEQKKTALSHTGT